MSALEPLLNDRILSEDHELVDDCAPYWAIPVSRFEQVRRESSVGIALLTSKCFRCKPGRGRFSFTQMLASAWPTFQQLQLLSARVASRWPNFICTLARSRNAGNMSKKVAGSLQAI